MARERSWSRDGRTQTAVLRLLGCSIVLCCVVSFAQLSVLTTQVATTTPGHASALRRSDRALVFAIKRSPDTDASAPRSSSIAAVEHASAHARTFTLPTIAGSIGRHTASSASRDQLGRSESSAATHGSAPALSLPSTRPGASPPSALKDIPQTAHASIEPSRTAPTPTSTAVKSIAPTRTPTHLEPRAPAIKTPAPTTAASPREQQQTSPPSAASHRQPKSKANVLPLPSPSPSPSPPPLQKPSPKPTPKPTRPVVRIPEPRVDVQSGRRGIVMCLFERIVPLGISLIRELRCLGNTERIEVFHCRELSAASQKLLRTIDSNVDVIDACSALVDRGVMDSELAVTFRSYWLKPLAVHQTTLEEIILLDADDVLLRDPAVLRTTPGYRANGTLFFYDRVVRRKEFFNRKYYVNGTDTSKSKPKRKARGRYLKHWVETFDYARFGLAPEPQPSAHLLASFAYRGKTCHEQDSSMLLINKRSAAKAMSVLWFLITEHRFIYAFSWGDKEAFWLAYEFSHTPYFFSPWGASVVSSAPNDDLTRHPTTLCGSLAHYMPVNDSSLAPELLYVNGKALVDPVPFDLGDTAHLRPNQVFNVLPTHVTPRQVRTAVDRPEQGRDFVECLTRLGAEPAPPALRAHLWRRRIHFLAISMDMLEPLASCSVDAHGLIRSTSTSSSSSSRSSSRTEVDGAVAPDERWQ